MTTEINPLAACERDNRTDELAEVELSKVTGGSQSTGAGAGKGHVQCDPDYEAERRGKP